MFRLVAAAVMLTIATPALANWQGTEWGQSLETTLDRPGVERVLPVIRDENGEGLARGRHEIAGVSTMATFYFEAGELSQVRLRINPNAAIDKVERALNDVYGRPDRQEAVGDVCRDATTVWLDRERGNRIEYLTSECIGGLSSYELVIAPIATADGSGL